MAYLRGWQVFLDDGTVLDSHSTVWADVPERIVAVKVFYADHTLLNWGDNWYGEPSSLKAGVDVPDEVFRVILAHAQRSVWPTDCI